MNPCRLATLLPVIALVALWTQADGLIFGGFFTPSRNGPGLCVGCRCGRAGGGGVNRLAGGSDVPNAMYPWLTAVYVGNRTVTGALISRMHVLTAASAVAGLPASAIKVGLDTGNVCDPSTTGTNVSVSAVTPLPQYDPSTGYGDLAVLTLPVSLTFSDRVRPVCLPPSTTSGYQNSVASVASWGSNSTNSSGATNATTAGTNGTATPTVPCRARQLLLPILAPSACSASGIGAQYVTADSGCIGTPGTQSLICPSDSGGLVQYNNSAFYQLIGIVPSTNNCSVPGPSVFTRVAPHLRWILSTTRDSCYCSAY